MPRWASPSSHVLHLIKDKHCILKGVLYTCYCINITFCHHFSYISYIGLIIIAKIKEYGSQPSNLVSAVNQDSLDKLFARVLWVHHETCHLQYSDH